MRDWTKKLINKYQKALVQYKYSPLSPKKLRSYEKRLEAIKPNSHDAETQVAAILINTKTNAVIAEGYNGFIRGAQDNKLPNKRPDKYPYMIHAEMNMIFNALRSGVLVDKAVVFCSLSPCVSCLRATYQCGIETIYFKDKYRDFEKNLEMKDMDVKVIKLEEFYMLKLGPK